MTLNHIHLQVRDLKAAIRWFETIWQVQPEFQNERIATFSFNSIVLIFDAATADTPATVGFQSDDCDRDFRSIVERGAIVLEPVWSKKSCHMAGCVRLPWQRLMDALD